MHGIGNWIARIQEHFFDASGDIESAALHVFKGCLVESIDSLLVRHLLNPKCFEMPLDEQSSQGVLVT